jgi:Xaa-Pro dipeptidase
MSKVLLPNEFHPLRYPFIAHGSGLIDEYPCVKFDNHHEGQIEAGMVMSVEAYSGPRAAAKASSSRSRSSSAMMDRK